ncbi:MAG: gluconate 2-dehydrogenase subunit 3 family protein [Sulfurimonadaceae bacterium]
MLQSSMINRRDFFQYGGAVGVALLVGIAAKKYALTNNASTETYKIFDALINHLFSDKDGYVTSKLNVMGYFKGVLSDKRIDIENREYLINGARWLNETANEEFNKDFVKLNHGQREELLKKVSMLRWGDNWLYKMMSYYFEAVFSDPVYGGNVDGAGWTWLEFQPGFPRPNEVAI